jgi:phenylalanyl-tRNA synthetase alpha chain
VKTQEVDKGVADALKIRKLVKAETWKTYNLKKGPKFALEKKKPATELTHEMLQK